MQEQPRNPLHGVTLETIVKTLVDRYGFEELGRRMPMRCFTNDPSIPSTLKMLRKTPWARSKVESFYLFHLREEKRRARREHSGALRGAGRLAVEATQGVTRVVEDMHRTIASGPAILGSPLEGPARAITGLVYGAVRGVTSVVGAGVELVLSEIGAMIGETAPGPEREAVTAVLNGVVGDHLEASGNALAIEMRLRHGGRALQAPLEGEKLVLLVHGSCMNDLQWTRHGHDHGRALAADLACGAVYLHYNSGRHVSENGRDLAALLEEETADVGEIVVVAHSMGGLVARSACHYGEGMAWRAKVSTLITLGTPHHGAPLERSGHMLESLLGVSRYSAPIATLARVRSAGVTDLRFGNVVDEDWRDRDRFARGAPHVTTPVPLPAGVACFAMAATTSAAGDDVNALAGDGLVPVASALGRHDDPSRALAFRDVHIEHGMGHLDLISSPNVYERVLAWSRLPKM